MAGVTEVSSNKIFGGWQKVFSHESDELKCKMNFGIYLPALSEEKKVPVIYWLSGLTCTEQNFITKSGFQQYAAQHNVCVVAPDTSPRGCNIEGEDDSYDFGSGAGFYVDAVEDKWKTNYRMYSYIVKELPNVIASNFPVDSEKASIMGHSMGGHGALTIYLKNTNKFKSVSAFAPICNPIACPWGQKAFTGYLGSDQGTWKSHDATCLVDDLGGPKRDILIDQGGSDNFLSGNQLLPENFVSACARADIPLLYRKHGGYDHSYFFISTFIGDHIAHHAKYLFA